MRHWLYLLERGEMNPVNLLKFTTLPAAAAILLLPAQAWAIQLHLTSEGIITHQMGHLFFLVSKIGRASCLGKVYI